jgi:hypothetical protein
MGSGGRQDGATFVGPTSRYRPRFTTTISIKTSTTIATSISLHGRSRMPNQVDVDRRYTMDAYGLCTCDSHFINRELLPAIAPHQYNRTPSLRAMAPWRCFNPDALPDGAIIAASPGSQPTAPESFPAAGSATKRSLACCYVSPLADPHWVLARNETAQVYWGRGS